MAKWLLCIISLALALVAVLPASSARPTSGHPHKFAPLPKASAAACAGVDPEALFYSRREAVEAYVTRTNYDMKTYVNRCARFYTNESAIILRGVGSYVGQQVVTEYGYLLFQEVNGVRLVAMHEAPDNQTLQWSTSAEGKAVGDVNDTVSFLTSYAFYQGRNPKTGQWSFAVGGLWNEQTLRFVACSDRILVDYVVSDPDIMPLYSAIHNKPVNVTCQNIMNRCTGSNQVYDTQAHCEVFLTKTKALTLPNTACPFPLSSNTAACRDYHADNAYFDPVVHCPHTSPQSQVCVDECTNVCSQCPLNSHCQVSYPSISADAAVYSCECDAGYVTVSSGFNGAMACAPATCSSDHDCDQPVAHCDNATSRCACQPTFTWSPDTAECTCDPASGSVFWDLGPASKLPSPACIPHGRCLLRQHCTAQDWEQVQCAQTSPPDLLSPFLSCLCNPGFIGGNHLPCSCPHGAAAISWSPVIEGQVCLAPGQCASDKDCPASARCDLPTGPSGTAASPIGSCA